MSDAPVSLMNQATVSDDVLVAVVKRQFECVHKALREAIGNCPAELWRAGRRAYFAPARLAFHMVQATDYHMDANPDAFDWNRFGVDWEEATPEQLPDSATVLGYLDEVEAKVSRRLDELGDAGLLGPDVKYFKTWLDHAIYTMRHAQHHLGQINSELKSAGLAPARWR